jgi:hypothetical protein
MTLSRLHQITSRRRRRFEQRRARYLRWLPAQHEFLTTDARLKLLRLGNQFGGKTTVGLSEVNFRCTGKHPFIDVTPPPIEAWIVCASWSQSVAIQRKFWELCDKDELDPDTVFDPMRGFRGKNPAVRYKNGSIVRFKTTNQGGLNLAGATIHFVLIDEPTEQRIFEELKKRLLRTNGSMALTLTPINGPTDYLRELAEKGALVDIWHRLEPEQLIPIGAELPMRLPDGTPMDDAWIERIRAETLDLEEPVIVDGEWETRTQGRVFGAFDPRPKGGRHITAVVPDVDLKVCLGVDHGQKDFKQVALLVGVDVSDPQNTRVHVLDEYVGEGNTLPKDDAKAILAMLARWGWRWEHIDHARGDKPYDGAASRRVSIRKSNKELMVAIKKQLGLSSRDRLTPYIKQAKTGAGGGRGSIDRGCTWLHRCMLREGGFTVHPRCKRLIESMEKWDYRDNDYKDPIDALRYATWTYAIQGGGSNGGNATVYVY